MKTLYHMETKPTKEMLISFLYGELEEVQMKEVKAYLEKNPEEALELEELDETKSQLHHLIDKEVVPPVFIQPKQAKVLDGKFYRSILKWGLAASIVGLLWMGAYFSNLKVEYGQNTINISFIEKTDENALEASSDTEKQWKIIQDSMESMFAKRNDSLMRHLTSLEGELKSIRESQARQRRASQDLSDSQIAALRETIREENYRSMVNTISMANQQQRDYAENLFAELADYVESQRELDLEMLEVAFNEMAQRNNLKQQETEILLAQLITSIQEQE
ncbi:MAG: hypothetical protein AAF824_15615 [Bacteroidota bacterium]